MAYTSGKVRELLLDVEVRKKGDVVGMKVIEPVRRGTYVLPV
jgi:hypothetical protein